MFESRKGCSRAEKDVLNRKGCSRIVLRPKKAICYPFVTKSVQKWGRTSHARKQAARTHISHTFQNGFRTHTHTCDRTSHVCVCARTFATHTYMNFTYREERSALHSKELTLKMPFVFALKAKIQY